MAYLKTKETRTVSNARKRYSGMIKIDEKHQNTVEYGSQTNPCNSTIYKDGLDNYASALEELNEIMSSADAKLNEVKDLEKKVASYYKRTLSGAISKFGEDASEVEMLGGIRKSERKKRKKKPEKTSVSPN